jgi:chemosensory pili system protein ChpA (sensor histidine kinase/response regulator)
MAPELAAFAPLDSVPAVPEVGPDGAVAEDAHAAQEDTTLLGDVSGLGDLSEPQPFRQTRFVEGEAQFQQIGPLRLPLADYKAFLNEADEWSRLLSAGLNEWSLDLGHQVRRALPVNLLALAHALAGSAARLGLEAITTLARTLEQAMTQQRGERELQVPATEAARIFLLAAEDIRYLLHQLAAGELKMPEPGLLDELAAAAGLDTPALLAPASPSALSASAGLLDAGLADPLGVVSEEPDLFSSAAPQAGSSNEWGYASLPEAASSIDAPGLASAPSALPLRQRLEARVDEVHGGLHELDLMLERLRAYLKSAGLPPETLKEIAAVQRHLQEALGELEEDLRGLDDDGEGGR